MVRKFFFENEKNIRKALPEIKKRIKIKLFLKGKIVFIEGKEYEEFMVEKILSAVDFGFELKEAFLLFNENYDFVVLNIKEYTKKKNLFYIRGRIIGKKRKSLKSMEDITGAKIILKRNKVGIISDYEHLEQIEDAIKSLIGGLKHGKIFSQLEKRNKELKNIEVDLGLKKFNKTN